MRQQLSIAVADRTPSPSVRELGPPSREVPAAALAAAAVAALLADAAGDPLAIRPRVRG